MATALWPSALPLPVQDGYRLTRGRDVTAISLEGGPSRVRRTSLGNPHRVTVTWICDESEYTGVTGFLRESRTELFRLPLLIDVPTTVPYLVRAIGEIGESESLDSTRGLMFWVSASLEVYPNPIRSRTLLLQNVSDTRVTVNNTAQGYAPDMVEFPNGRSVLLVGCRGPTAETPSEQFIDLDGQYVIASHPIDQAIVLTDAATVNSDWTVLGGTTSQAMTPEKRGGACILLPE